MYYSKYEGFMRHSKY